MNPSPDPALPPGQLPSPRCDWTSDEQGWVLKLSGDWRGVGQGALAAPPQAIDAGRVVVDARQLLAWDAALPALLWQTLAPLRRRRVALDIDTLPGALHAVIELALRAEPPRDAMTAAAPVPVARGLGWAARLGGRLRHNATEALVTANFVGEVMLALGRLIRGRSDMRWSDVVVQIDRCGPQSLPIVALTCALIGLMLAYMGGAQLDRIGAEAYIANVVTVGMVRELAGLMIGIILSGRLGAAFAAQLGSMHADEEVDALRVMGVDPIDYLVLPRLIALMMVAPMLWAYAALVGVLAGLPAASAVYGVPPADYLNKCLAVLSFKHVWIGLFKCGMYVVLLSIAGCREGLNAGRSTEAVGDAVTTAVVKSLVWIVTAATASTMVFQSLKL